MSSCDNTNRLSSQIHRRFMLPRDGGDSPDSGDGSSKKTSSMSTSSTSTSSTTTSSSTTSSSTTSSSTTSSSTTSSTSTSSDSRYYTSTSYTSNTQSSSSFTTTTTGTLTSSSSAYTSSTSNTSSSSAQNNQDSSTSTASQGLSTAARTGLSFGISEPTYMFRFFLRRIDFILVFFLIFSAIFFCYLRRRSRKARENASYRSALPAEVRKYRPPDLTALRERELPPPPRLDTTHLNPSDTPHSPPPSAISSVDPLLGNGSRPNSESISAWSRHSALSQVTDIPQIDTRQTSTLPNPHDPFLAPARSASYASTMASHSRPHDASVIGNVAMTSAFVAPGASSSGNSQPQRRLSALHMDLARHQKELELDHRKQGLDAQEEPQDPPPEYSS